MEDDDVRIEDMLRKTCMDEFVESKSSNSAPKILHKI